MSLWSTTIYSPSISQSSSNVTQETSSEVFYWLQWSFLYICIQWWSYNGGQTRYLFITSRTNPRSLATGGPWLSGKSPMTRHFLCDTLVMRHLLIGCQLGLKQLLLIGTYRGQDCFLNTDRLQPLPCFLPLSFLMCSLLSPVSFHIITYNNKWMFIVRFLCIWVILVLEVYLLVRSLISIFLVKEVSLKISKGR